KEESLRSVVTHADPMIATTHATAMARKKERGFMAGGLPMMVRIRGSARLRIDALAAAFVEGRSREARAHLLLRRARSATEGAGKSSGGGPSGPEPTAR